MHRPYRPDQQIRSWVALAALLPWSVGSSAGETDTMLAKRPLTERDTIEQTLLPSPDSPGAVRSPGDTVGVFSPDGQKFVVLLRKGNLGRNTNEYSLLLYHT